MQKAECATERPSNNEICECDVKARSRKSKRSTVRSSLREEFVAVWGLEDEPLGCPFQPNPVIFWEFETLGLKRYVDFL
jgi:hypothetical protein